MRSLLIISFVFAAIGLTQAPAQAQFNSGAFNRNLQARGRGTAQSVAGNILSRPTTSPYLALTDLNGLGGDNAANYFTSVRPRLEMQQNQQMQSRAMQTMQRDVSAMRSAAARRSQEGPRATGHPTRFQTYLQYYPGLRR